MAQFDVHRNQSAQTGERIPFLLVVQSDALSEFPRRVVVPLVPVAAVRALDGTLNAVIEVEGGRFAMLPTDIAALPTERLGACICNVAQDGERIIRALDFLIARH